ncbi:MAG TPA: SAM-dependent methyltransferase [Pseudonocardiaceae bacterium]
MTERASWVPAEVNVDVPSAARVYDYLLGGAHNFQVDRAVGEQVLKVLPNGAQIAGSNRAFLRRAVLRMLDEGIDQFLDLGSGIPTVGNVHEIAQRVNPRARVVYVDHDEVAVAHSELILGDNPHAAVLAGDLCRPEDILAHDTVTGLLDLNRPVGLLLVAVFHFVADERDPHGIVARYRDALPPGSLVALSHLTADHRPAEMASVVEAMKHSRDPMYFRTLDEVAAMFDGLELMEPGVVSAPLWHPEQGVVTAAPDDVYVGVGRRA